MGIKQAIVDSGFVSSIKILRDRSGDATIKMVVEIPESTGVVKRRFSKHYDKNSKSLKNISEILRAEFPNIIGDILE